MEINNIDVPEALVPVIMSAFAQYEVEVQMGRPATEAEKVRIHQHIPEFVRICMDQFSKTILTEENTNA